MNTTRGSNIADLLEAISKSNNFVINAERLSDPIIGEVIQWELAAAKTLRL
jgi:hypothetical protein